MSFGQKLRYWPKVHNIFINRFEAPGKPWVKQSSNSSFHFSSAFSHQDHCSLSLSGLPWISQQISCGSSNFPRGQRHFPVVAILGIFSINSGGITFTFTRFQQANHIASPKDQIVRGYSCLEFANKRPRPPALGNAVRHLPSIATWNIPWAASAATAARTTWKTPSSAGSWDTRRQLACAELATVAV